MIVYRMLGCDLMQFKLYRIAGMFRRVKVSVFEGENDFHGFYFCSFVSLHIKHRPRLTMSLSRGTTSDHAQLLFFVG